MQFKRSLCLFAIIAGLTGIILSASADYIGLSMTGGTQGFGIVNTTGTISGAVLLATGMLLTLRSSGSSDPADKDMRLNIHPSDSLMVASSIPTITMNENVFVQPVQPPNTVINTSRQPQPQTPQMSLNLMVNRSTPQLDNNEDEYDYECPTCGTDIKEKDINCPICGEEFE